MEHRSTRLLSENPVDFPLSGLLFLVLLGTSLSQVNGVPQFTGYGISLFLYLLVGYASLKNQRFLLVGGKIILWCYSIVIGVLVLHLWLSPTSPELTRVPVFALIAGFNLFVLPRTISLRKFLRTITFLSCIFVLLGTAALLVGEYGPFATFNSSVMLVPGVGPDVPVIQGPFRNPNTLGTIALVGSLGSLGIFLETKKKVALLALGLNAFGVYLTNSQAAQAGLLASLASIYVFRRYGTKMLLLMIVSGTVGAGLLLVDVVHPLVPGGLGIQGGRRQLWDAAFRGLMSQPLGHGSGLVGKKLLPYLPSGSPPTTIHNGWLRLFFTAGIVGGLAYTILFLWSLYSAIYRINSSSDLTVYAMLIGLSMFDFFHGATIFGLSVSSVLLALVLGYVQYFSFENDPQEEIQSRNAQ